MFITYQSGKYVTERCTTKKFSEENRAYSSLKLLIIYNFTKSELRDKTNDINKIGSPPKCVVVLFKTKE